MGCIWRASSSPAAANSGGFRVLGSFVPSVRNAKREAVLGARAGRSCAARNEGLTAVPLHPVLPRGRGRRANGLAGAHRTKWTIRAKGESFPESMPTRCRRSGGERQGSLRGKWRVPRSGRHRLRSEGDLARAQRSWPHLPGPSSPGTIGLILWEKVPSIWQVHALGVRCSASPCRRLAGAHLAVLRTGRTAGQGSIGCPIGRLRARLASGYGA